MGVCTSGGPASKWVLGVDSGFSLSLNESVAWDQLLHFSVAQFPHLLDSGNDIYFTHSVFIQQVRRD